MDSGSIMTYTVYVICFPESNLYYISPWKDPTSDILTAKRYKTEKSAGAASKRRHKQGVNCFHMGIKITVGPI